MSRVRARGLAVCLGVLVACGESAPDTGPVTAGGAAPAPMEAGTDGTTDPSRAEPGADASPVPPEAEDAGTPTQSGTAACTGDVWTCRYDDPTSGFPSCADYYSDDGWGEASVREHCAELAGGGAADVRASDSCYAEGLGADADPAGRCIVQSAAGGRVQLYGTPEAICTSFVGAWEAGLEPRCGGGSGAAPEGDGMESTCDGTEFFGFCVPDFGGGGGGDGSTQGSPDANVVSCGPAGADAPEVCGADQVCCFAGGLAADGFMCADDASQCPEDVQACDGPEDCAAGQFCCSGSSGGVCASSIDECTGTNLVGCHTLDDCAEFAPDAATCRQSAFGGTPWGICAD